MPRFRYTAIDRKGKNVQGELNAENKQDLSDQLKTFSLFLVSWKIAEEKPKSAAKPAPSSSTSDVDLADRDMGDFGSRPRAKWLPKRPVHYVILALIVATGVWVGAFLNMPKPTPEFMDAPPALVPKLLMIKPGLPRAEVEKLLTKRDSGDQFYRNTRYFVYPTTWIWVSYDATGGEWNPANQVIGWPYVANVRVPTGLIKNRTPA